MGYSCLIPSHVAAPGFVWALPWPIETPSEKCESCCLGKAPGGQQCDPGKLSMAGMGQGQPFGPLRETKLEPGASRGVTVTWPHNCHLLLLQPAGPQGSPRGWEGWDRDEEEEEEGRLLLATLGMGLERGHTLEKTYSGRILMKINLTRLIFSPDDDAGTI